MSRWSRAERQSGVAARSTCDRDMVRRMASQSEEEYLASLRPSMFRRVQAGEFGWTTVDLIDLGDANATALRSILEVFGINVNYLRAGQPRQLVAALDGRRAVAPYVIVTGHGDEGTLILNDDMPEPIAESQPFRGRLTPERIRQYLCLRGSTVIVNGCEGGHAALAEAFLDVGCVAYVGSTAAPFAYASTFVPVFLFYELTSQRNLRQAVQKLQQHDAELATWELYHR